MLTAVLDINYVCVTIYGCYHIWIFSVHYNSSRKDSVNTRFVSLDVAGKKLANTPLRCMTSEYQDTFGDRAPFWVLA